MNDQTGSGQLATIGLKDRFSRSEHGMSRDLISVEWREVMGSLSLDTDLSAQSKIVAALGRFNITRPPQEL